MIFSEFRNLVLSPKFEKMKGDRLYRYARECSVRLSYTAVRMFPSIRGNHITMVSLSILTIVFLLSFPDYSIASRTNVFIVQLLLLGLITITDKMDGEVARAQNFETQRGLFYDRAVHFFYPFTFFTTIGIFFHSGGAPITFLFVSLLAGQIYLMHFFLGEAKLTVREKILTGKLHPKDFVENRSSEKKSRPALPMRLFYYTMHMIYSWTLVLYVAIAILSIYSFESAIKVSALHLFITILWFGYRAFYVYPRRKLFARNILE